MGLDIMVKIRNAGDTKWVEVGYFRKYREFADWVRGRCDTIENEYTYVIYNEQIKELLNKISWYGQAVDALPKGLAFQVQEGEIPVNATAQEYLTKFTKDGEEYNWYAHVIFNPIYSDSPFPFVHICRLYHLMTVLSHLDDFVEVCVELSY